MSDTEPAESPAPQSATLRIVPPILGGGLTLLAIVWVLDVAPLLGIALFVEQLLAIVMGLATSAVYLTMPARKDTPRLRVPWYDGLAAIAAMALMIHITIAYERLLIDVSQRTPETLIIGILTVALTMEGLRRAAGWALFWVVVVFMAYALLADQVPGQLEGRGIPPKQLLIYLALDNNGLLGTPLKVGTTIVVAFILMGQLLFVSGGGQFFTDLAMATVGRRRGGAAKIAVAASALFGSISGTSVSNVVSTGTITIPMMRAAGYTAVQAGAIEAVASTGGQLMPPIMGAAAFLMAEFLEIPYTDVIFAAVIPALLYYFAVFIQVDLIAARDHISVVDSELPRTRRVLAQGWHFIIPFVVLLYAMFELLVEPQVAAIYASAVLLITGSVAGYGPHRMRPKDFLTSVWKTGLMMVGLFMILAGASFVIAVLNVTGLNFALTQALVQLGGGSLIALLLIAAVVCIILGMGMPTIGVYVLLATLIAPALVEVGVPALAAHLFILYFGMMSMITPPIAFAAYAAATITGADSWATGWASMRIGWVAYLIPFLFVATPGLMLEGAAGIIAVNVATTAFGVYLVSLAFIGYFSRPLSVTQRLVVGAAGFAAVAPAAIIGEVGLFVTAAGVAVGAAFLASQVVAQRRARAEAEAEAAE